MYHYVEELPPDAVGLLYDATLCIGCKACVASCKQANSVPGGALWSDGMTAPPYETLNGLPIWDAAQDLSVADGDVKVLNLKQRCTRFRGHRSPRFDGTGA